MALIVILPITAIIFRQPIVNSNPVRTEIDELMRRLTGRNVVISGNILIKDFPWVTIVIGPGKLNNPEGFEGPPLLSWQRITLKFHYSTLYKPEPLLGPIVIEGLVAEPRIDRAGRNNFSDLGPLEDAAPPAAALVIPRIELRDASIRYTDESISGDPIVSIEKLQFELDDLRRGAGPIEGSHFRTVSANIDGRLKIASGLRVPVERLIEAAFSRIELNMPEDAPLSFAAEEVRIGFGALQATLKNIAADPVRAQASLVIKPTALDALMRSAGLSPPFRSAPNLLQVRELSANLGYSDGALGADPFALQIDDTRVSGSIRLENPVRLSIVVDQIDFERYAAAFQGGGDYDPEAPLVFPGKLLQDLPLDGSIRFGKISARGTNLTGVSLRLESAPTRAPAPR